MYPLIFFDISILVCRRRDVRVFERRRCSALELILLRMFDADGASFFLLSDVPFFYLYACKDTKGSASAQHQDKFCHLFQCFDRNSVA